MRIPSGVTDQYVYFVAVDATDFTTRETGLASFTVYRSRNGAAAAAMTTPTINETDSTNMPGVYELLLDEDMTIGSGNDSEAMAFHITHAGMAPVTVEIELYRPKFTAGSTLSLAAINAEADTALTDYDPPTKAELDSGLAGLNDPTAAAIADAVWDEPTAGHTTASTFGEQAATDIDAILADTNELQTDDIPGTLTTIDGKIDTIDGNVDTLINRTRTIRGTAQGDGGGSNTIQLAAGAVTGDDELNEYLIFLLAGTGAGQERAITDSVASTDIVTVDGDWTTTPDSTTKYTVVGVA